MKKYMILGSNSFLGSSMVKFLQYKNHKLFLFSRSHQLPNRFCPYDKKNKNLKFYKLNFLKNHNELITWIKEIKPDYIINYAAQSMVGESWQNPGDWLRSNSYLTPLLYYKIALEKLSLKLIHISTPELYGDIKNQKEASTFRPTSPYALSRVNSDLLLPILKKEFRLEYKIIRASNIYGEYQRPYRLISSAVVRSKLGLKFYLEGNGFSRRNFLHAEDLSNATDLIIKKGKYEIYHISSKKIHTIKDLIIKICDTTKVKFQDFVINKKDRIGKDNIYHLNSERVERELKWKAKISIDEGINRVCKWADNYKNKFTKKDFTYYHKK